MKKFLALFLLISFSANALSLSGDDWKNPLRTKVWTPPAATDTLLGRLSTDVLQNKSMSGSQNTFTNLALTSLVPLTNDRAVISNASGFLTVSPTTATQIGYLSTLTSDVQTQLNAKASSTLANNNIFVGNVSNVATATPINAAVTGQPITGYSSLAGTISATDTILQALNKLNGNDALKQPLATITQKGGMYVGTGASTVAQHPPGSNGEILVWDSSNARGIINQKQGYIDTESMIQFTGIEDLTFNWTSGNSATYFASGTLAGTYAKDCTSTTISNKCTYVYTQAAGSLNDWISAPNFLVPSKYRAPTTVYFTFNYSYDGNSGDIVPILYSNVGSVILDMAPIKVMGATNGAVYSAVYAVSLASTQTSMSLGFHIKTLNSGKVLRFNDVKLTTDLSDVGVVAGINITDWVPYTTSVTAVTTNPTFGTIAVNQAYWRRVGDSMEIRYEFRQTSAGTVGSGAYKLELPPGYAIDFTKTKGGGISFGEVLGFGMSGGSAANQTITPTANTAQPTAIRFVDNSVGSDFGSSTSSAYSPANANWSFGFKATVPVVGWSSGNAQVAATNQITSSTTMTFVQKTSAVNCLTDALGTYNVFVINANGNAAVVASGAPTQTAASMAADGIALYPRLYTATAVAATPARFDVCIGKGLNNVVRNVYKNTGRLIPGNSEQLRISRTGVSGYFSSLQMVTYDVNTGRLSIDYSLNEDTQTSSKDFAFSDGTNGNPGYVTFTASTQPTVSVIPNASVCSSYECQDTYTALISSTNVITKTNSPGWITCTGSGVSTCTYNAALQAKLTQPMTCTATASSWAVEVGTNLTNFYVSRFNTTNGAGITTPDVYVTCSKSFPDNKPPMFKTANVIGVPSVAGITTNAVGNSTETFMLTYGATASTSCTTANTICPYNNSIGAGASVSKRNTAGTFTLSMPRTYVNFKCVGDVVAPGVSLATINSVVPECTNCNSVQFETANLSNVNVDTRGTLYCMGTF